VGYGDEDVDTQFSIPGSSSEPGVTVLPSEQKLAYEPIPYEPPVSIAPFEVPEGLIWDGNTQLAWDLERGLAYDPESGWLYHPETFVYYDLETRYAYDAETETLVDEATGQRFDMTTKQPIGESLAAEPAAEPPTTDEGGE
jgi:hypothetical protein